MPPEFDSYAREYSELLRDPVRDRFATTPLFFHQRKWGVIREFFDSLVDPHARRTGSTLAVAEVNYCVLGSLRLAVLPVVTCHRRC
jgi:hypothetical protein